MIAVGTKVCLVTGASRGIGKAIALELGKIEAPALEVVNEVKKLGGDAATIAADCK